MVMRKNVPVPMDVYLLYLDIKRELQRVVGRDVPWGLVLSAVYVALKRRCNDITRCVADVVSEAISAPQEVYVEEVGGEG